jgi:dipeptidyl aminopeptidase/acylaminoacyl peptidase
LLSAILLPSSLGTFVTGVASASAGQETHAFSVHDMLAMERISDPNVSPDGTRVAFNVRVTDLGANRGRTNLWLATTDGSSMRPLTEGSDGAWSARWMPDGKSLAYLAPQDGVVQVWKLTIDTGETSCLTDCPLDVGGFALFPDGERLLLTLDVYPELDPKDALAETARRDAERAASPVKARIYDELLYRHWDTWEDGKRGHLFVLAEGEYTDLMPGWDVDCPTKPFGGMEEVAISPDGAEVAFAAKNVGTEAAWSTNVDIWSVATDGRSAPVCLTESNEAYDNSPSYSPDGRWLAWLAMKEPGYESDRQRLMVRDLQHMAEPTLVVTARWDRSASSIAWSADSKTIYTSAADVGNRSIFAIGIPDGPVTRLAHEGTNRGPQVAGDRILYVHDDLGSPVEIRSMAQDGSDVKPVTELNANRLAGARIGEWEQFSFPGWNDETVHGYVLKPADYTQGETYPVAFLIHGGPQGSFGDHFHYRWNPQAYAGAGYAAVFIDFHGSTGYGQVFTDSIQGDWGGKPYEDLMKGLDFALERYPFLDGTRVGALGASFGGYMINWVAGHTDRFRCLINHDGNLDERMAYFDTEELWFPERDHMGTPWENPEGYAKHNPILHVDKWKTPMLVIHGAKDYRVVDVQGMATFTALQRQGVPSRLLYFPDENHWVLKPQNSILWHETVISWLDQWLRPEARVVPASHGGGGGR